MTNHSSEAGGSDSIGRVSVPYFSGDRCNMTGLSCQNSLAESLLVGFEIRDEETRDFLRSLIMSGRVPEEEFKLLFRISFLCGAEDWNLLLDCAAAHRELAVSQGRPILEDTDLTPYVEYVLSGGTQPGRDRETSAGCRAGNSNKRSSKKQHRQKESSHFWRDAEVPSDGPEHSRYPKQARIIERQTQRVDRGPMQPVIKTRQSRDTEQVVLAVDKDKATVMTKHKFDMAEAYTNSTEWNAKACKMSPADRVQPGRQTKSFYFRSPRPKREPSSARPARGTASSRPFPSLSAPRFGLIQEECAHDPFRLMVAVTFLIRTKGQSAIPVFRRVMEQFPTPAALAAADPERELVLMIRHLGLSTVRCAAIQKYARMWLEKPPSKEVRFGVANYPACGGRYNVRSGEVFGPEGDDLSQGIVNGPRGDNSLPSDSPGTRRRAVGSAWEIGHITQGSYAIDSWRIFCRDVLLGRAEDWMGKGREPTFQPEWMRVLPADKELRAYLRWMWMREGWDWDPETGSGSVLTEEMQLAVEDGRISYDDKGDLVIVQQPSVVKRATQTCGS
ncbi:hypothetical protein VTK73DRAFT_5721 [Phialemonium thermophilum]|uniref:HhH-GPD domain-containing protein n=1 Tax=Phialemonium thermophilum TaxID=223376 RepID=A0ABR3XWY5_9PEZI